jgi:hypothetical protein
MRATARRPVPLRGQQRGRRTAALIYSRQAVTLATAPCISDIATEYTCLATDDAGALLNDRRSTWAG